MMLFSLFLKVFFVIYVMSECLNQPLMNPVKTINLTEICMQHCLRCLIGYNNSDVYLFVKVKQASPLPQAAHIGVFWVQGVAQTNQEAQQQQDGGALQSRHGPEGKNDRHLQKHKRLSKNGTGPKHIPFCY